MSPGPRNGVEPGSEAALAAAVRTLGGEGVRGEIGVVLGSGLSSFADGLDVARRVPYALIPGVPPPRVTGHRGALLAAGLAGKDVLVLSGRVHHYEGHGPRAVTFGVRLLAALGVGTVIVSNASGGIDPGFDVGDLMLIVDQISMVGGPRRLAGAPFSVVGVYSHRLRRLALREAAETGIALRSGVYMGSLGPTYETPAEIAMARRLGASAVGMSTVSEVQAAARLGLEVLGVALITNVPLPGRFTATTHAEVLEAGAAGGRSLLSLVKGVLERL